jgi:peptide deformylase
MTYPTNLQLHTENHPILRQVAEPVTVFDDDLLRFIDRMFDRMEAWGGIGLAAPQVGVSRRIVVTRHQDQLRSWINPWVDVPPGASVGVGEERCLSFPGQRATVQRYARVTVYYQSSIGKRARKYCARGDFLGIVLQHEIDHLNGRVLPDAAVPGTLVRLSLSPRGKSPLDRSIASP